MLVLEHVQQQQQKTDNQSLILVPYLNKIKLVHHLIEASSPTLTQSAL